MNNNLARELEIDVPLRSPEAPKESPVHMPAPRKAGITRIEKLLVVSVSIVVFALMTFYISQEIMISTLNRTLQDKTVTIANEQNVNENLSQEIQELSRYDRVYEIAKKAGLTMNEANIRNVSK
ncbi:cell division protein FtsL [Carnobacterium gallinarum]|uniref:cell division protein FtsL n=1 Tax=Carnobacterium gallinarum TaxID=2749 RepID=UPI001FDF49B7|nr:cell division protein FtsL [Carnobacterium gallinarum]